MSTDTAASPTGDLELQDRRRSGPSHSRYHLRSHSQSLCDRMKPDFGFKKLGGYFILYEGDYFNLILGPDWAGVLFTLLFLHLLTILLNQFILVSDSVDHGFWQVIIFSLFIGTNISFLVVALKDPGIVRRDRVPIPTDEADLERMPYCDICDLHQPPRAMHCSNCDCCIIGLDHHCPWVGKCIGKDNMFFFIIFNMIWLTYFAVFVYLMVVA
jgi:hypothetical protein